MQENISLFLAIEKLIQDKMYFHQGMCVVNDADFAEFVEVDIKELRSDVSINMNRFPPDFIVEITDGEYAFAQPGIIMLLGLVRSESALNAHLQFIKYFAKLAHERGTGVFDMLNNRKNEL